MLEQLILAGIWFLRNAVGIVLRPYETYRRIAERGKLVELIYVAALSACYFALASLVRTAAFRPFLLTKQFVKLGAGSLAGYLLTVVLLWLVARLFGGRGKIGQVAITWGYTLVPTVIWFLATSILYVVLPPPRTIRMEGILFSILYLVFSATLFWWKVTLAYLTLRHGMKLDLLRIIGVVAITAPVLAVYSVLMYRLGIFRVPFL